MSYPFSSRFGRHLYEALPELYRSRDLEECGGDLAGYLDSFGALLDSVYDTLDQRLRDCFPETCQSWLLPYFAQLLDLTLLSPHDAGRRREVASAVKWRQGKGTLATVREIAAAVGGLETLAIREGWQRVARTARPGESVAAVTVDFSRVRPPFASGGPDDGSRRTVDLRTPDWRQGHYHPKSLLLYAPPPAGFFRGAAYRFTWGEVAADGAWRRQGKEWVPVAEWIAVRDDEGGRRISRKRDDPSSTVRIRGTIVLDGGKDYRFSGINADTIVVKPGSTVSLENLAVHLVVVEKGGAEPALSARSCLITRISAAGSVVQLEYCTVTGMVQAETLLASDTIFMGVAVRTPCRVGKTAGAAPPSACLRYCRIEPAQKLTGAHTLAGSISTLRPLFYSRLPGDPGCAVLHPAAHRALRQGAEDGGELGAFHERRHVLAWDAVPRKLLDYLPLGVAPVLVPDPPSPASGQ